MRWPYDTTGLAPPTLANTLNHHWPKGERLIAEVLGVASEQIWPSRYRKTEYRQN
ncbi:helix-turn-helix domain-containing protein [Salmonella enterica]|nr:transcriptional regulator [Salmonella enterica subsp. enterica]EFV1553385.1 transcriptional regulator [Salmonella enterica]EGZ3936633.1 transcriptional regulator [Salmonella enterica subsp. enterica serovar Albuquerque]EJP5978174.1 helix-turn-helix domain-containing protein [Salmonella enterica]EJT9341343.1 helix-turn-helix domain-containing protein [Salmonella enterica]